MNTTMQTPDIRTYQVHGTSIQATPAQHAALLEELAYWYPRCSERLIVVSVDGGLIRVRSERTPMWFGFDRLINGAGNVDVAVSEQRAHDPDLSPEALLSLVRDALASESGSAYLAALQQVLST